MSKKSIRIWGIVGIIFGIVATIFILAPGRFEAGNANTLANAILMTAAVCVVSIGCALLLSEKSK